MKIAEAKKLLASYYQTFGNAVFLVLPCGQKELKTKGWEKITFEDTQKPAYQKRLLQALMNRGNIAVRLGPLSEGLCAIDIDCGKDRIEEFLALNPGLVETARVYGRRGCQIFFRLTPGTPFPTAGNKGYVKLDFSDGQNFGEWRFGETAGAYSLIYGQHPEDREVVYRLEGDRVLEIAFADIKWPPDVRLPWLEEANSSSIPPSPEFVHIPPELAKRIQSYLEHCPPSIAGKRGDDALFKAACRIANGFALTEDQTYEALACWFNPLCKPPWNEQRLRYKAQEAQKVEHRKPRGHFLNVEEGYPPLDERPCFKVHSQVWNDGRRLRRSGTYYHTIAKPKRGESELEPALIDLRICAPLKVLAITASREDSEYGWLVEFTSRNRQRKRWAIPARYFAGRGEEALGELLALGLEVVRKERNLVLEYVASAQPKERYAAALSTGWHDEHTFVLPSEVIGTTEVWYQGKDEQNPYARAGEFEQWQKQIAARARCNSNLIVALCGALAGPLFKLLNVPGGGLHWFGPTTMGKTTILEAAQSVWGGPHYRRTWETTAVGLQAIAMLHEGKYGAFDSLHGFKSGAEFSDALRQSASQHFGHAGPRFVDALIGAMKAGLDLSDRLIEMQKFFEPVNEPQRRVSRTFAILAFAGELAAQWELLPWEPGKALDACALLFKRWQKQALVNAASSPERKMLAIVANFIDRFGDDRFSDLNNRDDEKTRVRDRAGYWLDESEPAEGKVSLDPQIAAGWRQTRRIYLFTATGLREATKGHDFEQEVLRALKAAGAFFKTDSDQLSVSVRTPQGLKRMYFIDPLKLR